MQSSKNKKSFQPNMNTLKFPFHPSSMAMVYLTNTRNIQTVKNCCQQALSKTKSAAKISKTIFPNILPILKETPYSLWVHFLWVKLEVLWGWMKWNAVLTPNSKPFAIKVKLKRDLIHPNQPRKGLQGEKKKRHTRMVQLEQ